MLIYNGLFLRINYEKKHKRFVNSWVKSPSTKNQFKAEMLHYARLLKENTFNQILWLQSNFTFQMDDECKIWLDKTVNGINVGESWLTKDNTGCHHLYIAVGEDVLAQIEAMGIFKKQLKTNLKPRYFASEKEARVLLDGGSTNLKRKKLPIEINYKGTDNNGRSIIEIKDDSSHIESSIQSIKSLLEERDFMNSNKEKYLSLTSREKQILSFIATGYSNQELSLELLVSVHTVRTHRNRIWKKLEISSLYEAIKYNPFFK